MTGDERCLCCDGPRHIPGRPGRSGRGLCARCYARLRSRGPEHLAVYPRLVCGVRGLALIEDLTVMAESGETREGAARRLGIKPGSVHRACLRAGRTDLWEALA